MKQKKYQGVPMKLRNHILPLLIALYSLLIANCATVATGPDDLDIAIRDTSDYLNDNIPKGNKIVILNIQSDHASLSEYIIDELIANAVNDKVFSVVDRAQLDQIRMELNFQLSGEVSDQSALEIGKFLGAQTIVTGTIGELADRHRMRIRALNVETAEVQGQYNRNIAASRTIAALMKGGKSTATTYGSANRTGGGTNSGSGTASTSQGNTPAQTRQPTGMKNGTYTLWPRPRATQAGLPADMWIPQVIATNDYIVIFFAEKAAGDFSDGRSGIYYSEWRDANLIQLQDLDNPSRFYKPVSINKSDNGGGRIWSMSFRRFPATRFSLTCEKVGFHPNQTPMVFEEIILGEPD
jgi:hypothetical protein